VGVGRGVKSGGEAKEKREGSGASSSSLAAYDTKPNRAMKKKERERKKRRESYCSSDLVQGGFSIFKPFHVLWEY
jgi:hypothetical protein